MLQCAMPGEVGPVCAHFAICNNATRDCSCSGVTYVPFTLCTVPMWQTSDELNASFLAYKGIVLGLQSLVLLTCIAFAVAHVVRLLRPRPGHRRPRVWATEQTGLLMVAMSAIIDIAYMAADPYWRQWPDLSQGADAFIYFLGDLFLAFDAAAYGVLAALWFMTRSRYNVGTPWSPLTRVLLGTTISLPFVAALIALILRLVDDISVRDAAQYLFFATVVAVALLYGTIIVVFGALTLRDLARANESLGIGRVSNATPLRTSLVRRLAIQIVFSGIVLLLGVACLIIFLVVPVDSPLTFIWVQLFAPQFVFFLTQLPVLYLFRARLDKSVVASGTMGSKTGSGMISSESKAGPNDSVEVVEVEQLPDKWDLAAVDL